MVLFRFVLLMLLSCIGITVYVTGTGREYNKRIFAANVGQARLP
jgi:hypothetical protein